MPFNVQVTIPYIYRDDSLFRTEKQDDTSRRNMDGSQPDILASIREDIFRIRAFLENRRQGWEAHLTLGTRVMGQLDSLTTFPQGVTVTEQIWILDTLQRLAYFDPDGGGAQDVALWCLNGWLRILELNPTNSGVLQGLGHAWLYRAQKCLARIHHNEGSSSSGDSGWFDHRYSSRDEARDVTAATREADARLHTADYVEARGILLPATEYFSRAVESAERSNTVTGELLALAAEAFMSLGNVSHSTINERYFRQALVYLRSASQIPGYTLSSYLQHYLDDYGRLIDQ